MTVTRLFGGLTPGDGGDPRTFPAIWNATADVIDGLREGFTFVETVYFTSSGTFSKADYPWLRAIRVKCQSGGGGGGGADSGQTGAGGSGGGYSESFITDIAGLDASVTVTVGAGGTGGAAGGADSTDGGLSSFGSLVVGALGEGTITAGLNPRGTTNTDGVGDLILWGGAGGAGATNSTAPGGAGGNSHLGGGGRSTRGLTPFVGQQGGQYGGGGGGGVDNNAGGNGGAGIVIVELYG